MQMVGPANHLAGFLLSQRYFYQDLILHIIESSGPRYKTEMPDRGQAFVFL